jgi:RNA polymerase sigma-70 factor (ECF subfamily)
MDSDEALFQRLTEGDMRAFDRLYDRFERPLFGFLCTQIGDAGEAEDALHEAFIAVLRERDKVTELRSFRAWLFEVARNLCLNRVRSRKRTGRALEAATQLETVKAPPLGAEQRLERHEQSLLLERAVARLPMPLAEVYRLRATGMSYDEVAEVLRVPVGTVKSRMHEMVKRLREEVPR